MKLFDCFLFYNELELLELRLETLYDVIDKFVIVEANKTFSGKDKLFNFELNKEMFAVYLDKIIYVKVEDSPLPKSKINFWNVECFQRNCILRGLENVAEFGDRILVSDADEIINPETLRTALNNDAWVSFEQNLYYYYLNLQQNNNFVGPVLAKYGTFKTPEELRLEGRKIKIIKNGGWHFSFLGGAERIREKISVYSESQTNSKILQNIDVIEYLINSKQDIFGRKNVSYNIVEINESFPKYTNELIKKYPNLLYQGNSNKTGINKNILKINILDKIKASIRKNFIKIVFKIQRPMILRKFK
jgi:beta-1,4-mannosyl-glycoprotein beta-1,4-N-acetylglucosaminyltransferase